MTQVTAPSSPASSAIAKKSVGRGISYPFIDLEEAIAQAKKFYVEERKSSVPVASAIKHFGYSEASSGGRQTISALLQFGLLEDEGRKDNRSVRLTNRALTVLLAESDSEERTEALRACARMPKIYAELLAKYGEELPSDSTLNYYLRKEKDFNPKTVDAFIKDFRSSLAFADSHKKPADPDSVPKARRPSDQEVAIGDSVQWESGGVLQFSSPKKVVNKQQHDGEWWAQVEGSNTGILVSELTLVEKAAAEINPIFSSATVSRPSAPIFGSASPTIGNGVDPVASTEREWMRGPLSKGTDYRILINGEMGAREIGRLIKILEVQKSVLDDDED